MKQVSELQERLDAQGSSAQQSSQAIRATEQRTAVLQRQMRVKVFVLCSCPVLMHMLVSVHMLSVPGTNCCMLHNKKTAVQFLLAGSD